MTDPNYELATKVHDAFRKTPGLAAFDHYPSHNDAWLAAARAAREHIAGEAKEPTKTLRDEFAMTIANGLVSNPRVETFCPIKTWEVADAMANAMLSARTAAQKDDAVAELVAVAQEAVPLVGYTAHVPELVEKLEAAIAKVRGS